MPFPYLFQNQEARGRGVQLNAPTFAISPCAKLVEAIHALPLLHYREVPPTKRARHVLPLHFSLQQIFLCGLCSGCVLCERRGWCAELF